MIKHHMQKPNMKKAYLLALYKYIELTDMSPEELLNEAEIEAENCASRNKLHKA
jgi:hypothetical protein